MRLSDLPAVLAVQAACYAPPFVEAAATLRARLATAPDTAWVAEITEITRIATADRVPCAYLTAYRSRLGRVTPLGGDFHPAAQADTLYLHDLAVTPARAGSGCGGRLVALALDAAGREGLHVALVSVGDSLAFWQRHGFRIAPPAADATQRAHLASYPGDARYMVRPA